MKKLICLMAGVLATTLSFAGSEWEHSYIKFRTLGPDTYADGTPVLDGEYYALVWVPNSSNTQSFCANGTVLTNNGCKILASGPWAMAHCCADVYEEGGETQKDYYVLNISNTECQKMVANGSFRLCLLDSRNASGSLVTTTTNIVGECGTYTVPTTVNGYVTTAQMTGSEAAVATRLGVSSPIQVATASSVPNTVKPPEIVGVELKGEGDNRVMVLKVKCTYEYLQYTVAGGATITGIDKTTGVTNATVADGKGNGDQTTIIPLTVPAKGNQKFYQVIRREIRPASDN